MKIFLLEQDSCVGGYDYVSGLVVRAVSEHVARYYAAESSGDEGRGLWFDPSRSTCVELTGEGEPGLVLRDFNAG